MRALRWLLLVPARLAVLYLLFVATVATHVLVERNLRPAAAFDRGICSHRGMTFALKALLHGSMALAVLVLAAACAVADVATHALHRRRPGAVRRLRATAGGGCWRGSCSTPSWSDCRKN
jgi:hypothetical protein